MCHNRPFLKHFYNMNREFNLRQIAEDDWEKGDFRPIAEIHKTTNELFKSYEVNFSEYFEEGLGYKRKSAFFQTPSGRRFVVTEICEYPFPLTNIYVLYDSTTATQDLDEIKQLLDLTESDLDLVYKF